MRSTKPFKETLEGLRELQGISGREMARRAQNAGFDRTFAAMWSAINGKTPLLPHHMEGVAKALKVSPETFAEYRLWLARRSYDPGEVGWKTALSNLKALEEAGGLEPKRHSAAAHLRKPSADEDLDESP